VEIVVLKIFCVRFQVFTVVITKVTVFRDVVLCSDLENGGSMFLQNIS
jgi:hypothetical protein